MKTILETFKKYYLEYDEKHKILYIKAPIPVRELYRLKSSLKNVEEEVLDIRLEEKGKYYY